MTHVIADPCLGSVCEACAVICPIDCIHLSQKHAAHQTSPRLEIDPEFCIDCGLCVDECPVGAIHVEEDLPEEP